MPPTCPAWCCIVRVTSGGDISAYDVVSGLFPDKQKDFVFNISETDTVLVKEIRKRHRPHRYGEAGRQHRGHPVTASTTSRLSSASAPPSPTSRIWLPPSRRPRSPWRSARCSTPSRQIIRYDNLGIARLIYQLPTTVCEMFLREVFKQGSIERLDQETLFTIQRFFENNLNVSETSRGLFVHRNTLVYRLEKIKKLTGLDLREFDDAIVFKVALMVKKYLSNNPAKY